MSAQFTDKELGTIFALVRREAVSLGYGTTWHPGNRAQWPHRLKRLGIIAQKIHTMRWSNSDQ